MAKVRVIAPDGSTGTIEDSELSDARAQGYRVESDAAAAPVTAPAAAPVRVRAPDGSTGTIDPSELDAAKAQGYTDLAEERFQTTGQKLATVGEGLARGASMGISDVVQAKGAGLGTGIGNWLYDKLNPESPTAGQHNLYDARAAQESGADITGRREANKGLAVGSEIVGAVAPAILSGGVGSAAASAKLTPAGQLASLATKMSTMFGAQGATAVGRITALAATGAVEGAIDSAVRRVTSDLAAGNVDITAERALDAAWEGAKWGGLAAGGAGIVSEGVQAGIKGAKAVAEKVAEKLPSVDDFANGQAFRAALGGRNLAAVHKAERHGGPQAIGEMLNRYGVTKGAADVETIAERTGMLRDDIGKQIGAAVDEITAAGGAGPSRADLAQRIYSDVIDPLAKDAAKRPIARQLEGRVKDIIDDLTAPGDDAINLEQLNNLRKSMDDVAAWGKRAPSESDQAYMDVRNAVSQYWADAAEKAAESAGKPELAANLKRLKGEYSKIAFANDVAEDAVKRNVANRMVSPSDYGVGAAASVVGAVGSGGAGLVPLVMGAAGTAANKLMRERGNSLVASTLYKLTRGAVSQEQTTAKAVASTLQNLAKSTAVVSAPIASRAAANSNATKADYSKLVAQSQELQDPNSPASQQLDAMTLQLAGESPELADAIRQKVLQKATMIVQKMGPATDPSDPMKRQPVLADPITQTRRDRFMRAVQNPAQALERLSSGQGSAEDLAVVRELTPMVHKRYVDGVLERVMASKTPLSAAQKQRLLFTIGQPVSREQTPEYQRFFSQLIGGKKQPSEQGQMGQLPKERQAPFNGKDLKLDSSHWASRADGLMGASDD